MIKRDGKLHSILDDLKFSDFALSFFLVVIAITASRIMLLYTGERNDSDLIFVLVIFIISFVTTGYFWGISSSIIGTICINYYFMAPYGQFNMTKPGYPLAIITLLGVSIATCTLTSRIKRQKEAAIESERRTLELYEANQRLNDERTAILLEAEKEKMRGNLLRAISHDLRTPLTTILGSTTLILEDGRNMEEKDVLQMLTNIRDDSEWLIGMVENILSVTRFQPDSTPLKTHDEIIEDVISDAIITTRKRFPEYHINFEIPDEIVMAPMDSMLIKQVIINLIENAIRHSGDKEHISCSTYTKDHYAVIEVKDRGKGLTPDEEAHASTGDSTKGLGIGLPVCETIVKAHNGYFESENREGGGALFRFGLPLKETLDESNSSTDTTCSDAPSDNSDY